MYFINFSFKKYLNLKLKLRYFQPTIKTFQPNKILIKQRNKALFISDDKSLCYIIKYRTRA